MPRHGNDKIVARPGIPEPGVVWSGVSCSDILEGSVVSARRPCEDTGLAGLGVGILLTAVVFGLDLARV